MTKAQIKKELLARMWAMHADKTSNIDAMIPRKDHPQIALMIEKNKGFMMAIEDMSELIHSRRWF